MIRAIAVAVMVLSAAAAAAQTVKDSGERPETPEPLTSDPGSPGGERPDGPSAGPGGRDASVGRPSLPAAGERDANCRVRRADTDTGFVVVCEEDG